MKRYHFSFPALILSVALVSIQAREMFFTFIGERPPGKRIAAFHETDGCHKHIDDAGVLLFPCRSAERFMQCEWVFPDQFFWMIDADQSQIRCHGLADIRQSG